jgi:hypothetical protein
MWVELNSITYGFVFKLYQNRNALVMSDLKNI